MERVMLAVDRWKKKGADALLALAQVCADTIVALVLFWILNFIFSWTYVWVGIIFVMSLLIRSGLWDKWDL